MKRLQTFTPPGDSTASLVDGWRFIKSDVPGAEQENFNDQLGRHFYPPHLNALDGQDLGNYYRGWLPPSFLHRSSETGRQLFVHFNGVNTVTDVWVNSNYLGQHRGGFGMFRFEMTSVARVGGDNVLAVRVSNAPFADVAPLTADFTFFGGIYRGVHVLTVDPVHVLMWNYASPGIFLTPSNVTATSATLALRGDVYNGDTFAQDIEVQTTVGADQSILTIWIPSSHQKATSVPISSKPSPQSASVAAATIRTSTPHVPVSTAAKRAMIVQPLDFRSFRLMQTTAFLNEIISTSMVSTAIKTYSIMLATS